MGPATEAEKRAAAEAAALLVQDGMSVGLGTGSTVAYLIPALAERSLSIRCVATSPETERVARSLGLSVEAFEELDHLDLAIDGADQFDPDGWLVKGGGGAHTREKVVAVSAERFVIIVDSTKRVAELRPPIPLELLEFGLASTLRRLSDVEVRSTVKSPDGGIIADFHGAVGDPRRLARSFEATPGVVGHGLFAPEIVGTILVASGSTVESIAVSDA